MRDEQAVGSPTVPTTGIPSFRSDRPKNTFNPHAAGALPVMDQINREGGQAAETGRRQRARAPGNAAWSVPPAAAPRHSFLLLPSGAVPADRPDHTCRGFPPHGAPDGVSSPLFHQQRSLCRVHRRSRPLRQARGGCRNRNRHPGAGGRACRRGERPRRRHQPQCRPLRRRERTQQRPRRPRDRGVLRPAGGAGAAAAVRRDPVEPAQACRRAAQPRRSRLARRCEVSLHFRAVRPVPRAAQAGRPDVSSWSPRIPTSISSAS